MKAAYLVIGIVLLAFAYIVYQISVPWIEWKGDLFPMPVWTQMRILAPIAYIFGAIGVIAIVFGLTENPALRLFFSFIAVIGCLGLITGVISIESLTKLISSIGVKV